MHPPDLAIRRSLRLVRPRSRRQLRGYVQWVLGFRMPRWPIVAGHCSPMEYLVHSFYEDHEPRDCIVWANRGGGKTQLGAIATLLDMLFKPGIQVRILAGSFEQSSRMYRYLRQFLEHDLFNDLVTGKVTGRFVELVNGSRVEVLAQSECAVRGQRVHRLRCDEVELFHQDVWEAAQFVTRSGWCGDTYVHASIESLSTMHQPFGLVQRLIQKSTPRNRRVFQWSVLDTLERCPPERLCEPCELWLDCEGRAKEAEGFIAIDDAIRQRMRVDDASWNAEMLCIEPDRSSTVYPEFDPKLHVGELPQPAGDALWIGGMDFGHRDPTVLLWAYLVRSGEHDDLLCIVDEYSRVDHIVEEHIAAASARPWPRPAWIGADPAGNIRNDQTGHSTINIWRRHGWVIRTRGSRIQEGITAVRRRLLGPPIVRSGERINPIRLRVHPRCKTLIQSLTKYHYPPNDERSETPVKDGNDHAADALRYMILNLDARGGRAHVRGY